MSCSPPRNPGVMGLCRISISRRRIKVLGRSSTQTIFSDVRTFLDRTRRLSEVCANRLIVSRRLLYRERGGGGESETPIDLQSVEGTPGPPSHRRSVVPLRTGVPRGIALAGYTGYGRDDSGGTRVVLCVRNQGARKRPHVRAIRRSRGRRRQPVCVRRKAIRSLCVHRLGAKSVFFKRLLPVLRDSSPRIPGLPPRVRARRWVRGFRAGRPRVVSGRGN